MDVREKLVELIAQKVCDTWSESCDEWLPHDCGKCYANDCHISEIADHLIINGVTVQEWIPVTERLPEIYDKDPDWSKTVLFRTVVGHIHSGYRNIGRPQPSVYDDDWTPPYWIDESENLYFEEDEVTHWMPLPEPLKGEEDKNEVT